jgi:hypothetical protein
MNERIKELATQAGLQNTLGCFWQSGDHDLERFAELVRQDERTSNSKNIDVTDLVLRAKAEEREAIAKICDESTNLDWFAKEIRARGEPSPAFKNYMGDNWAGIV